MKTPQRILRLRARRIRVLRRALGVSQQDIATLLGLHRPAVSEIEAGRRDLSLHEAVVLCGRLGCTLQWLDGWPCLP